MSPTSADREVAGRAADSLLLTFGLFAIVAALAAVVALAVA